MVGAEDGILVLKGKVEYLEHVSKNYEFLNTGNGYIGIWDTV